MFTNIAFSVDQQDEFEVELAERPLVTVTRAETRTTTTHLLARLNATKEMLLFNQDSVVSLDDDQIASYAAEKERYAAACARTSASASALVQTEELGAREIGTAARVPELCTASVGVSECVIYDELLAGSNGESDDEALPEAVPEVAAVEQTTEVEGMTAGEEPSDAGTLFTALGTEDGTVFDDAGTVITALSGEPSLLSETTARSGAPVGSIITETERVAVATADDAALEASRGARYLSRNARSVLETLCLLESIVEESAFPHALECALGTSPAPPMPPGLGTAATSELLTTALRAQNDTEVAQGPFTRTDPSLAFAARLYAPALEGLPALCHARCPGTGIDCAGDAIFAVGYGHIGGLTEVPHAASDSAGPASGGASTGGWGETPGASETQHTPTSARLHGSGTVAAAAAIAAALAGGDTGTESEPRGAIALFNAAAPSNARLVIRTPAAVTRLAWHPELTFYVAATFDDGRAAVYDLGSAFADARVWPAPVVVPPTALSNYGTETAAGGRHHGPVWGCSWITDAGAGGSTPTDLLLTVGADGSARTHSLRKAWESTRLVSLTGGAGSGAGRRPATALSVSPHDPSSYLVGSENNVYRASRTYAEQILGTWAPHSGVVMALAHSPFEPGVAASAGSDSCVAIWSTEGEPGSLPVRSTRLDDHGTCLAWSPVAATLLAVGTRGGKLWVFDLETSFNEPAFTGDFDCPVTDISWSTGGQIAVTLANGSLLLLRTEGFAAKIEGDQTEVLSTALGLV